jgi:hypothetical protein
VPISESKQDQLGLLKAVEQIAWSGLTKNSGLLRKIFAAAQANRSAAYVIEKGSSLKIV